MRSQLDTCKIVRILQMIMVIIIFIVSVKIMTLRRPVSSPNHGAAFPDINFLCSLCGERLAKCSHNKYELKRTDLRHCFHINAKSQFSHDVAHIA